MAIDHLTPAYTDSARPFVEEFGGKMGGLEYLADRDPGLKEAILPRVVVHPDEAAPEAWPFPHAEAVIVRGSHPHDFQGLVDVLPTRTVRRADSKALATAVEKVRTLSAEALEYGRYENPSFDGKVVVGIQPFLSLHTSRFERGSIVEHPNRPGKYMVTSEFGDFGEAPHGTFESGLYDERGEIITPYSLSPRRNVAQQVEIYERIKRAQLVEKGMSFQVEFAENGHSTRIFQARAFLPQEEATFRLPSDSEQPQRLTLGVTPRDGVALPVYFTTNGERIVEPKQDWALLKFYNGAPTPLSFQPGRMRVYLPFQRASGPVTTLDHEHFRLAQKASVTAFERGRDYVPLLLNSEGKSLVGGDYEKTRRTLWSAAFEGLQSRQVFVCSDGIHSIVRPID